MVPPQPGYIQLGVSVEALVGRQACVRARPGGGAASSHCRPAVHAPAPHAAAAAPWLPQELLSAKEGSRLGDKLDFGARVGMNLFNFLAGFATQAGGDAIVIPSNALDRCRWAGASRAALVVTGALQACSVAGGATGTAWTGGGVHCDDRSCGLGPPRPGLLGLQVDGSFHREDEAGPRVPDSAGEARVTGLRPPHVPRLAAGAQLP
jgi:hypothetical protein